MNDLEVFLERKLIKLRTSIQSLRSKMNLLESYGLGSQVKQTHKIYNQVLHEYYQRERQLQQIRRYNGQRRSLQEQ